MTKKAFYTDYKTAIEWLNLNLILCNNIPYVDESVWDNTRFVSYDEEADEYIDIFQWYITSANDFDVEYLEKTFEGIYFTYSNMLDCYVLCVTHYGTSWDYVPCQVIDEEWARINKDKEYKH